MTENIWNTKIGPFYDTKALIGWLHVSRSTVYRRTARGELLGLKTSDNKYLYPTSQFNETGEAPVGLRYVLLELDPSLDDLWGDALWLFTPASALGGDRPIDRIHRGDMDEVLLIARRIRATLSDRAAR